MTPPPFEGIQPWRIATRQAVAPPVPGLCQRNAQQSALAGAVWSP
jgi:hypothetical protein